MRLSVLVPSRDRSGGIVDVLSPLLADDAVAEVVVVDDGSTDATPARLAELAAGSDTLIVLRTEGLGKAAAEQLGLGRCTGDVVLFLDDDVVAEPGLAVGHLRHHEATPGLVVLGYMPVTPPPTAPGHGPARVYAADYERTCVTWERDPSTILHNLWGGNVSMRRVDALRVGVASPNFDPRWRHSDRDLGLRCLEAGLSGRFDRTLRADHRYDRTLERYVSEVVAQAHGRVMVHRLHESVIGPFAPSELWRGMSAKRAAIVRAGATAAGHGPVLRLLRAAIAASVRRGDTAKEDALVRLLRRSETAYQAARFVSAGDRSEAEQSRR